VCYVAYRLNDVRRSRIERDERAHRARHFAPLRRRVNRDHPRTHRYRELRRR
jgi:hypothetical protein